MDSCLILTCVCYTLENNYLWSWCCVESWSAILKYLSSLYLIGERWEDGGGKRKNLDLFISFDLTTEVVVTEAWGMVLSRLKNTCCWVLWRKLCQVQVSVWVLHTGPQSTEETYCNMAGQRLVEAKTGIPETFRKDQEDARVPATGLYPIIMWASWTTREGKSFNTNSHPMKWI